MTMDVVDQNLQLVSAAVFVIGFILSVLTGSGSSVQLGELPEKHYELLVEIQKNKKFSGINAFIIIRLLRRIEKTSEITKLQFEVLYKYFGKEVPQ